MLGAASLASLAAMRSGVGLVTLGIPKSLNSTVQKKISSVVMTWPLKETPQQTLSLSAFAEIQKRLDSFDVIAIGPGLSKNASTQRLVLKIIETAQQPLVIDADALNAVASRPGCLTKTRTIKILTPHSGEMARLLKVDKTVIENNRVKVAKDFAQKHRCILLLKGHHTVVADQDGTTYINKTGNPGMAKAGSGDVLTGMVAAFLAQGMPEFNATKFAAYFHGRAGDLAAEAKSRVGMIATDIIDQIPMAITLRAIETKPNLFKQ
ncbi:MAG: NAD(P)H-hydrate dehydratase [Omnitrophica WOR_2 bacterium RIFCSPHIGHO2_01_FULL_48_9]|nr:MAG: NAD(P)H-hydrate dehydratase [Omnitrophica WOR_2 bacterium RIFCSPHIGHO2_02_FULL_48_11]OGX30051.1 MAG: NAD(P)H-hydrate dehydratase [Omnitrophica WOR_2 bacterium RIFCSPHIGHO2_01_FULL_48_9]